MADGKLTAKQEAFCREYLIDLNATKAAIRAGYSEKTAKDIACENLAKPYLADRISELMQERNERNKIDADYVLKRLTDIDQMDVIDILAENGELKPVREWPKVWRTTLSGMDVSEINTQDGPSGLLKKIKWPDKVKNIELIGKHIQVQAFKEQVFSEHSGPGGGPIQVADISEQELDDRLKEMGYGRSRNQLSEKSTDS